MTASQRKEEIALLAVGLARDLGWENVRFHDIAAAAGISLADLYDIFEDKVCVLSVYGRYVDKKTLRDVGAMDQSVPVRERLFDVMMTRFDVLNEQRDGVISILKSFKADPKQAVISMPYLARSMNWMLEAADIDTSGIKGALRIAGLKIIYLKALREWMRDSGSDMPKTMAALDQALGQVENWATRLGL